jgi:hypothetical protein
MKKKFFIGIAMSLFAIATVFNMNISEQGNAGDVSLDAIKVMAKADGELSSKIWEIYHRPSGGHNCWKGGNKKCL